MMDEKKKEDVDAVEMTDEPAAVEAEPLPAEPSKPGCIRSFFKTRRMAIGICVLALLLAANIAVLGLQKHGCKGIRGPGCRVVAECEYKQGPKAEKGEKGSGYKDSYEDMDCQYKEQGQREACKGKGAVKGKGARGDK